MIKLNHTKLTIVSCSISLFRLLLQRQDVFYTTNEHYIMEYAENSILMSSSIGEFNPLPDDKF